MEDIGNQFMENKNLKTYSCTRKKGIDDLICEYAFIGNSQGDESCSNIAGDFAGGWHSFTFDCDPYDQEAINKESERRKIKNLKYIQELKDKGEYGKSYEWTIHIIHNPIFDNPTPIKPSLESHRMIFIDESE